MILKKEELVQLLEVAPPINFSNSMMVNCMSKSDGVAMGSPLGALMVNAGFMCHLEENLARDGMVPSLGTDH